MNPVSPLKRLALKNPDGVGGSPVPMVDVDIAEVGTSSGTLPVLGTSRDERKLSEAKRSLSAGVILRLSLFACSAEGVSQQRTPSSDARSHSKSQSASRALS